MGQDGVTYCRGSETVPRSDRRFGGSAERGANLLLCAPERNERNERAFGRLVGQEAPDDFHFVFVTFARSVEARLETVRTLASPSPSGIGVVLAGGLDRSVREELLVDEGDVSVEYFTVRDATNLGRVGLTLENHLRNHEGEHFVLSVDSVSDVIELTSQERAYQFFQRLVTYLDTFDSVAVFHLYTRETGTVSQRFRDLFDEVLTPEDLLPAEGTAELPGFVWLTEDDLQDGFLWLREEDLRDGFLWLREEDVRRRDRSLESPDENEVTPSETPENGVSDPKAAGGADGANERDGDETGRVRSCDAHAVESGPTPQSPTDTGRSEAGDGRGKSRTSDVVVRTSGGTDAVSSSGSAGESEGDSDGDESDEADDGRRASRSGQTGRESARRLRRVVASVKSRLVGDGRGDTDDD